MNRFALCTSLFAASSYRRALITLATGRPVIKCYILVSNSSPCLTVITDIGFIRRANTWAVKCHFVENDAATMLLQATYIFASEYYVLSAKYG